MESSVSNQVNFSEKEMMKYSRNIMLTDIGVEGQKLLKNSTVTIIGVGGLGCACSQYLVASGIGNLNLFDPDQVDLSNLQRQILFLEEDLNAFKVDAAVKSLLRLNPDVNIKKFRQSFEKNSVPDEITKSEIIIDCSDNFETRRYTNNYCYKNKNTYQLLVNNSFRSKAEEIIQKNDKLVFTLYSVVDWYYRDCLSGDCKLLKIIEDSILVEKISDAQEDTDKLVATNPFYKLKILINK